MTHLHSEICIGNPEGILPDELFIAWLLRRNSREGRPIKPITDAWVGGFPELSRPMLGWRVVLKRGLKTIDQAWSFSSDAANLVAANHSIVPIYTANTSRGIVDSMARLLDGTGDNNSRLVQDLEYIRNRPSYGRIQYCAACCREQINQYGIHYYKREWAIPYVRCCPIHREWLRSPKCHCDEGRERPSLMARFLATRCSDCASDLFQSNPEHPSAHALKVSSWFSDWLRDPLPYMGPSKIQHCIEQTTSRLKFLDIGPLRFHRCGMYCDVFSCTDRVDWMFDYGGVLNVNSVAHTMRGFRNSCGIPAFLTFWLPVILAFDTYAEFRHVLNAAPAARSCNSLLGLGTNIASSIY